MHTMHDRPLAGVDLNLLVLLRALLTERHVTRAAAQVGLSQSAASHALARLRTLYGDELLVRHGRSLAPTPRALAILPELERGLAQLGATISGQPAFDAATAQRVFTLGMADYGQAVLLGPLLKELGRTAPGVNLSVIVGLELNELLDNGSIELAVQVGGRLAPTLRARRLFSDRFACLVRRGHPDVGKKVSLERYLALRHVVVAPSGSPGSVVDSALAERGLSRNIALRVTSFLIAPLVVAESDFMNTGPERLALRVAELYGLRVLPPPLRLPAFAMHLGWHARFDGEPGHRWLRDCIARVSSTL
jgi:DNA-binding transcriptional LysR family regulator